MVHYSLLLTFPTVPCLSLYPYTARNHHAYMHPIPHLSHKIPGDNVQKQSYPQDKIEIVLADFYSEDNTYEVAQKNGCIILRDHNPDMEYRRTLALKNCSGEYIFIADDDNFFVNPDLIKNMVTVIEDEDASAVECVWEYYDKKDYATNRYCSLLNLDSQKNYHHLQ